MLARLAGFQNFQNLPASPFHSDRFDRSEALRLLDFIAFKGRCASFDTGEGLRRLLLKRKLQNLSLWAFWVFCPKAQRFPSVR